MNDIIRKQMKDVTVPNNDVIRRPQTVPEPYVAPTKKEERGRIEKNPFFAKVRKSESEPPRDRSSRSHALVWAFLAVLLLAGVFAVANYFASATIEITPIMRSISLDSDFTAVASDKAVEGDLIFNYTATSTEKIKDVPATVEKKIQKKASGKVFIYNAYSNSSQRLIKNTRLKDNKTDKVYRIDESVVVPGLKVVAGKIEPGSVESTVYADGPGDSYDIKLLEGGGDFSIPGFKGDPRFAKFYGRMNEKFPIGGGFDGTKKVPTDEVIAIAQKNLKEDLKTIAIEKARAQIPDGMSLFPGSVIIKFEDVPQEDASKVGVRATASVFFFDTTMLTKNFVAALSLEDKGKTFVVSNMPALDFKFVDPVDNAVLSDISKMNFHIKGDAVFIGKIDTQKIRMELAGKEKKDFGKIIVDQNGIDKANMIIRPMWKTAFPVDLAKITVKILGN